MVRSFDSELRRSPVPYSSAESLLLTPCLSAQARLHGQQDPAIKQGGKEVAQAVETIALMIDCSFAPPDICVLSRSGTY